MTTTASKIFALRKDETFLQLAQLAALNCIDSVVLAGTDKVSERNSSPKEGEISFNEAQQRFDFARALQDNVEQLVNNSLALRLASYEGVLAIFDGEKNASEEAQMDILTKAFTGYCKVKFKVSN